MTKKKTVTVYLPSGMKLGHSSQLNFYADNPKEMSSKMLFQQPNQPTKDNSCHQIEHINNIPKNSVSTSCDHNAKDSLTNTQCKVNSVVSSKPPLTICKNKNVALEQYDFKINENVIFDVDVTDLKLMLDKQLKCSVSSNITEHTEQPVSHLKPINPKPTCNQEINVTNIPNNSSKSLPNTKIDEVPQECSVQKDAPPKLHRQKSFISQVHDRLKKNAKFRKEPKQQTKISSEEKKIIKEDYEHLRIKINNKLTCECEECGEFINCPAWYHNNVQFEKLDSVSKNAVPLLRTNGQATDITIMKNFDSKIILHGVVIPKPLFALDETHFHKSIESGLRKMNYTSVKNLQSYMWPAIQRGLNVFMVGAPGSGKTLAYLPAFCSFAMEKNRRYASLSKYEGPLVLILCPNSKKCEEINNLMGHLMEECWEAVQVEVLTEDSQIETDITCDILVSTPSVLEEYLKSGRVKLKRLCHFAIEDGHFLLKNHSQSIEKILKILNTLQMNRPHNKNIQVIVSSEQWTIDLETLLKILYTSPLVCFEDFLEAAKYSKVEFFKKKLTSAHKLFYLEDILKNRYMTHKTVVFCNDTEIARVKQHFVVSGVEFISLQKDLIEDELFENEDMWCFLKNGRYKVLLCTDALFEKTVHILNANWIIHFSRPSSWDQFQKRFRCLSANFCSPLAAEDNQSQDKCSFLLIDETFNEFAEFFNVLTCSFVKHLQL